MFHRVLQNDVHRWVDRFMSSLNQSDSDEVHVPPQLHSHVMADTMAPSFSVAKNGLVMLDYDGSLREFTERYEDATPTKEIYGILNDLGSFEDINLFINSGRDKDTLGGWFSDLPISLIAEHGSWIKKAGAPDWERMGPAPDLSWKDQVRPVLEEYMDRTPGARIEEKSAAMVWHYREADDALGEWQALELLSVLEDILSNYPVEILSGARIVEVRQRGVDKGRAYEFVAEEDGPFDFVLATGDDRTDEDLFRRLEDDAYSIKVGGGQSSARASVGSPGSARRMLRGLIEARKRVHQKTP